MVVFRLKKVSESTRKVQNVRQLITQIRQKVFQKGAFPAVIIYGLSANALTEKVSESLLKVQNVRQLTTKIRQEVF